MKHKSIKNPSLFVRLVKPDNLLLLTTLFLPVFALAAGGFNELTDLAKTIRTAIYSLIGIVIAITAVWQCWLGANGRRTWPEVMETGLWAIAAGASIAFFTWLFTKGGSMTF